MGGRGEGASDVCPFDSEGPYRELHVFSVVRVVMCEWVLFRVFF